jgi:hypothetical protein
MLSRRGTAEWLDSVDREVVLPRARAPIVVCGLNRERKAAGRNRHPRKDPTDAHWVPRSESKTVQRPNFQ